MMRQRPLQTVRRPRGYDHYQHGGREWVNCIPSNSFTRVFLADQLLVLQFPEMHAPGQTDLFSRQRHLLRFCSLGLLGLVYLTGE